MIYTTKHLQSIIRLIQKMLVHNRIKFFHKAPSLNFCSSPSIFFIPFIFFSTYSALAQDAGNINVEGGAIEVSEELYEEIAKWTKDDRTKGTQSILSHLFNSNIDKKEVDAFLGKYFSGDFSVNKSGCNCKTIIPSLNRIRTVGNYVSTQDSEKGKFQRVYTHWDGAAMYFNHQNGYKKSHQSNYTMPNVFEWHRILVLCTDMGVILESCNCNKAVYSEMLFNSNITTSGRQWGLFSSGFKMNVNTGFIVFSFEEPKLATNASSNLQIIGYDGVEYSISGGKNVTTTNLPSVASSLTSAVFGFVHQVNPLIPATNSFTALSLEQHLNAITIKESVSANSSNNRDKFMVYTATVRANIPFNIVMLSKASILGAGKNNHETIGHIKSQTRFSAYIPLNTHSYDMYGDLEPDSRYSCCNEALGFWSHSTMYADNTEKGNYESASMNHLNNMGLNNYGHSDNGTVLNGNIVKVSGQTGTVYSVDNCHCTGLLVEPTSKEIIQPKLLSEFDEYCNDDFLISIDPNIWPQVFQKFQNNQIDIRWFRNGVAIQAINPTHPNQILCSASGNYWVELVALPEEECRSLDFYTILPCDPGKNNEMLPAISSNLTLDQTKQMDYDMKLYPNPVADNFLNIIVESNTESEILDYVVININGQIVSKGQAITNKAIELNMGHLPQGQYFVKCIVQQSGYQKALKFVKL